MSVTAAKGFRAAGVTAGLKSSGAPDVALVVNDGPRFAAAGVFTRNRVKAAPVLWSQQVLSAQIVRAVVLNSGGANACTGSDGFLDTHRTAEHVGGLLDVGAAEVAVCSTGLIGIRLPMSRLLPGIAAAAALPLPTHQRRVQCIVRAGCGAGCGAGRGRAGCGGGGRPGLGAAQASA